MEGGLGFKRLDYQLSTWIFIWWILFANGFIKYNPKLFIIIATIVDLLLILIGIAFIGKYSMMYWIFTVLYIIITKFVPYYNLQFKNDSNTHDNTFGVLLTIFYLFYLNINGTNPIQIYTSQLKGW